MRRKEKEITEKQQIIDIIKQSIVCQIAFHDDEYPYILPFNYGYFDNSLYIHSALSGKKLELIKRNNKVAFTISLPYEIQTGPLSCDWTTNYKSVIGFGSIEILTTHEEKIRGLDIIMAQHGKIENNTYNENALKRMLILRLNIESLTGKQSGEF